MSRRDDVESYTTGVTVYGGPVDPPAEKVTFADVVARDHQVRPIVPAWLRNRDQRTETARGAARLAAHRAAYHLTRAPKYAAKVALWAPAGVGRIAVGLAKWTLDTEQWGLRQQAANRDNFEEYRALAAQKDKHVAARWPVTAALCMAVLAVVAALTIWASWPLIALIVVVCSLVLARVGRPADAPIVDRVVIGQPFTRLTGEQVRAALVAVGVGIKSGADLRFPPPGIHRDGPGWLARVNLPAGITAVRVMERREELSSALRLPVDQCWPAVGPEHAGQLDLWVGYQPASRMGRPKWSLVSPTAVTNVFDGVPVGFDQRQRPVITVPFERNYLIGGQPGSGKTFAGRALALGVLLDPTAEVWLAAFKPSEDFYDVSGFCARYECGLDAGTMAAAEAMVADGLAEVQRRQRVLGQLKRAGRIRDGRTDAALARQGLGLHPLVLFFDEVHELFLGSAQAVQDMIRLIKQGRSAGVMVVLLTQVASKDAVPTEITRCVSSRWCMSVQDYTANDQIMGTGAYKRGLSGTQFRPRIDAGWGVTSGVADLDGPVRAYYPSEEELAVILRRIAQLRAGGGNTTNTEPEAPARDLLRDVIYVFSVVDRPGLQWERLADELGRAWPEHYGQLSARTCSAMIRELGIPGAQIKADGANRQGVYRDQVIHAIEAREIEPGSGR